MLRGIAKGVLLAGFGSMPGGATAYQMLTRDWMGTQATHVDKQARVWPTYANVWSTTAGLELEGLRVWVHGGGWTPFPFLANYLLTGDAGVVTNAAGRMLDRYLARAVNGVLECGLPSTAGLDRRRPDIEKFRWYEEVAEAVADLGGELYEAVDVAALPLEAESVDLSHSGGTLEHVPPDELRTFLGEARRVLRPGGVMSHVFDHRDHLHHADSTWPYLAHLRLSPAAYHVLCGNPLLYHNRLLPAEVATMFESAGFEKIAVRRMTLPDHRYVDSGKEVMSAAPGIERSALAAAFRHASEADLRTAAAHYVYRKPAR